MYNKYSLHKILYSASASFEKEQLNRSDKQIIADDYSVKI